jgi:hypothetical protein
MLNVRAWASAYNVSLETVRRIARGDTYRDGLQPAAPLAQVIPPQAAPPTLEPDEGEIAASFARFVAASEAEAARPVAQDMLDELLERGRNQPGLPGGRRTEGGLPDEEP